jgi:uracil-DNA glycosylase
MDQNIKNTPDYAASLVDWWASAGADYYVNEQSVSLLSPENPVTGNTNMQHNQHVLQEPAKQDIGKTQQNTSEADWPNTADALITQIASAISLPGNNYGGKPAVPIGHINCELMIIYDLPDPDEIISGKLSHGTSGELLNNMIVATGRKLSDCFITALATTRPAIGDIPDEDVGQLAKFMLHQIGLVGPKEILILGSTACQALLNADLMSMRGNLGNINHDNRITPVIVTYHPRNLLAQPKMKAQAWKDLQMLVKKGNS